MENENIANNASNVLISSPREDVAGRQCENALERSTQTGIAGAAQRTGQDFVLDSALPLNRQSFPNPPLGEKLACTIPNIRHLIYSYKIKVEYNVIKKKLRVKIPGHKGSFENADEVALTQINSLAALNGIKIGQISSIISALGDRELYCPASNWIRSRVWDGVDRLPEICETLKERKGYNSDLKYTLVKKWLLSAVAAVLKPEGFHCRGVLTLQGPQSIGKTSWINSLVSDPLLRADLVKLDHHLDAGNKDSIMTAVSHWITEIGELDSSFKKDIARLKGFLTSDHDKLRRPYARTDSEYPRRTIFCASVNEHNFLVDTTGNSRWWTIEVEKINFNHNIDMQQVFAQLAVDYESGKEWWLTEEEEAMLEDVNNRHRTVNAIHERLYAIVDVDHNSGMQKEHVSLTPTELLRKIGIEYPSNPQCKDCVAFLRQYFGESKRNKGYDKWKVPLKTMEIVPILKPVEKAHDNSLRSDDDF